MVGGLHPEGLQGLYLPSSETEKSQEIATETSMIYWIEEPTLARQKGAGATAHHLMANGR